LSSPLDVTAVTQSHGFLVEYRYTTTVMRCLSSLVALLGAASAVAAQQATCYWPNGDEAQGEKPCTDDSGASWCCGENYYCGSNKLCIWASPEKDGLLRYGRGSCTDKTFKDKNCPDFCFAKDGFGWDSGSAVSRCKGEEEKYYCAIASSVDCASYSATFSLDVPTILAPLAAAQTETVTVTGSASTTAPPSLTDSSTVSNTSGAPQTSSTGASDGDSEKQEGDASSGSGSSNNVAIGVGVGVGVAVGIIAAVALFLFLRRRRAKEPQQQVQPAMQQPTYSPQQPGYYQQQQQPVYSTHTPSPSMGHNPPLVHHQQAVPPMHQHQHQAYKPPSVHEVHGSPQPRHEAP
jgi:hypothetical protein